MRWVIARVLPVPAPARMHTGPAGAVTARCCSGSSPASTRSAASTATQASWQAAAMGRRLVRESGGIPRIPVHQRRAGMEATPAALKPGEPISPEVSFPPEVPLHADDVLDPLVWLLPPARCPAGPGAHPLPGGGHRTGRDRKSVV